MINIFDSLFNEVYLQQVANDLETSEDTEDDLILVEEDDIRFPVSDNYRYGYNINNYNYCTYC